MEKRTDRHTAVHVDLAINVSAVFGLAAGTQALHEQWVPPAVIQRALINREPGRSATSATPDLSSHGEQSTLHTERKGLI